MDIPILTNDGTESHCEAACDSSKSASCVFSGENSKQLWAEIEALDSLSTGDDIRHVLYSFGCAMQELEAKLTHII